MEEEEPCCAVIAARKIKKLIVNGQEFGIAQLDDIIHKVFALDLTGDKAIGRALIKELKIFNYVPPNMETCYRMAMLEEYKNRRR